MAGEAAFHAAAARVLTAQATHKHLLARHAMQLYGLHEQALHGDISTERPRCPINYDGKAKWDAWNARRGMSNAAAQAEYVQLVHAILPEDAPNSESASSGTSRQSMARRIKRYKPQKAGQTSFPRLVGTFFGTLALLLVATTVAISLSRTISDVCRPLAHASGACDIWLASHSIRVTVGWVSIGLAFGTLLQSNVRPACPLEQNHFTCSPQLLQWNILSVLYYVDAPRGTAQERSEASEGAADLDLLHSLGLVLGKVGAATEEHPVMVFKPVPGSAALGSTRSVLEHPIEITADMHFRRFKEPFPDPAQPAIAGIELVEEVPLPKWRCVYRKRRLKLQNNTPGFIKRFANAEFFDVAEESLWDQANHVLYVRGRNESFAHLVLVEDFLLFQRHDERDGWYDATNHCRRVTMA
ncbi:hypothetical protein, variant 4 [Aphanomyces invadans]|uniref:ACB domain-containing protein n=1 Tax=Aphanomyces invadans TaxID=157072 RepID=A0A024TXJ6_9STRA|nr:hypothetical protein, variant 4 [Aphanomyces invadans]ETV98709.1 hypothetical protein, variant 4 [Aphanomyces invadans]|eukprot:XP_008872906.1 hypothetical protein, variant 4 [Aphanomyces invadans]